MSPFEVVYGFNPLTPVDLLPLPRNEHFNVNGRDRARAIKELHKNVQESLAKAADTYAKYSNKGRKRLLLKPGDWVWIHMRKERFPAKRKNKLSPRGDGPFKVLEKINENAYKLELPSEYGINASFNVADLVLFETDEEVADRLTGQPSQGGGNGVEARSATTIPEGPCSRNRAKRFMDRISKLLMTEECQKELKEENTIKPTTLIMLQFNESGVGPYMPSMGSTISD